MKRRRSVSRIKFYRIMNAVLMGMTALNWMIGALLLKIQGSAEAGGFVFFALLFVFCASVAAFDDRRSSNRFSQMITTYILGLLMLCLEEMMLWTYAGFSWWPIVSFALENVLFWRYFVQHHPRPL